METTWNHCLFTFGMSSNTSPSIWPAVKDSNEIANPAPVVSCSSFLSQRRCLGQFEQSVRPAMICQGSFLQKFFDNVLGTFYLPGYVSGSSIWGLGSGLVSQVHGLGDALGVGGEKCLQQSRFTFSEWAETWPI